MAATDPRNASPSEGLPTAVDRAAESFAHLATCVMGREADAAVLAALTETRTRCDAASAERPGQRALFVNLQTALSTWQQVWPRLGGQGEFRAAVAREAEQWAKKLTGLAKS